MWKAITELFCPPTLNNIDYDSFYLALEVGDLLLVEAFIADGANIENRTNDDRGFTALGVALAHGREEVIDYLLSQNANIYATDKKNNTLLALAAYSNNRVRTEFFLNQGLDIECKGFRGNTPLIVASWRGHIEVVRLLQERGANVNAINKFGDTALILAARLGRLDMVAYLCEHGADLNIQGEKGNTALMVASEAGNAEVVEFLVSKGANQDLKNDKGDTALSLAKKHQHGESCNALGISGEITLQKRLDNIGCGDKIPTAYCCPLSFEIMDDPITLSNGQTFDRASLKRHFIMVEKEFPCPLTRQAIKIEELNFGTNIVIRELCEAFVESQEEMVKQNEHSEANEQQLVPVIIKKRSSENVYRLFSNAKGKEFRSEEDELEDITDRTPLLNSASSSSSSN